MKKLFVVFTISVMLLGFTIEVNAMAAYNHVTDGHGFDCTFVCGLTCRNEWDLKPGQKESRPGKKGTFFIYFPWCQPPFNEVGDVYVPAHGWVEITGPVGHNITGLPIYKNISYDKHGKIVDSATFSNCVKW